MDAEFRQRFDRIEQRLDRLDKKLTTLLQAKKAEKKETWVRVSFIKQVTSWNNEQMRRAREQGIIRYKKNEAGLWYLIESIHPMFLAIKTDAQKGTQDK